MESLSITKRLSLRTLCENRDNLDIYSWLSDPESHFLWSKNRKLLSFEISMDLFFRNLRAQIHDFFIIQKSDNSGTFPAGMIYTYNCDLTDRLTYLCLYLPEKYRNRGLGLEASIIMCEYLYKTYNLRKIFTEIFSYNLLSINSCIKNGFEEVAILRDYRYYSGKYHDLHILCLDNDKFQKIKLITLEKINRAEKVWGKYQ